MTKYIVQIEGHKFSLELREGSESLEAVIDGKSKPVQLREIEGGSTVSAIIGDRSLEVDITPGESGYVIHYRGHTYECVVEDSDTVELKRMMNRTSEAITQKELRAPMPGLVVSIAVSAGQEVNAGDALLILEAMKMENEIRATFGGTIQAVKVQVGQAVELNELLIVFA